MKKKFIKMAFEEESIMSGDELTEKLDGIIEEQKNMQLYKLKNTPVFLWEKKAESEYSLKFYHSYKTDMCDTALTVMVEKGLERSTLKGFFHKPKGIWAVFFGVIGSLFIDFLILSYCLLFVADFNLMNGLMISALATMVRIYVCVSLLELDRDRMKKIKEYVLPLIREKAKKENENEGN